MDQFANNKEKSQSLPELPLDNLDTPKSQKRRSSKKHDKANIIDPQKRQSSKIKTVKIKSRGPMPTEDGSMDRALTIEEMIEKLRNKNSLNALYNFATTIYSEENISFLKCYIDLRESLLEDDLNSTKCRTELYDFLNTFFSEQSAYELNVPETFVNNITKLRNSICDNKANINGKEVIATLDNIHQYILKSTAENCISPYLQYIKSIKKSVYETSNAPGKSRVVVVGGGFLGATVASFLDKLNVAFHVTLIEPKNAFEHTPAMVQAVVDPNEYPSLKVNYEDIIKNGTLITGCVTKVLPDKVILGENVEIPFDYAVLSMGSTYGSQLKTADATEKFRKKNILVQHEVLKKANKVLIIGGGLVGTELASEIRGNYKNKAVVLIDSNQRLLKSCHPKTSEIAKIALEKMGVEVILNKRIVDHNSIENTYITCDGTTIIAEMVHWCTGARPNTESLTAFPDKSILDENNLIRVRKTMQVEGYDNMFAGGDIKSFQEEKVAFRAMSDAFIITKNILKIEIAKRNKMSPQNATETLQLNVQLAERGTDGYPALENKSKKYFGTAFTIGPKRNSALYSKVTPFNTVFHYKGETVYDLKDCFKAYVMMQITGDKDHFKKIPQAKYKMVVDTNIGPAPDIEKYRLKFKKK